MKNAIIVIRHGDDLSTPPAWPAYVVSYTLPNGKNVNVPHHGLKQDGIDRANLLSTIIPKWLSDNGYSPIARVITKDPTSLDYTPNPFETIYPTIKQSSINDVVLLQSLSDIQKSISNNQISSSEGSTIICWDVEGMWSPKDSSGNHTENPLPNSILGMLSSSQISTYPVKAGTLYTFVDTSLKIFNVINNQIV